jgi:hypothetical protein
MVTVVIPTLCKSMDIMKMSIKELNKSKLVKDIIIIDNTEGSYCAKRKKEWVVGTGDYSVNKAWNIGVDMAQTPYFLLLNDDVIVHREAIQAFADIFDSDDRVGLGIIDTCNITSLKEYDRKRIKSKIPPYSFAPDSCTAGHFIFGRKELYTPIPELLRVFYGDDYLHHMIRKQGKYVVHLHEHKIWHRMSTTVKTMGYYHTGILENEKFIFNKLIAGEA